MTQTKNVAILVFNDVEVLDFCGPLEVFSVASRQMEYQAFNVFTVADQSEPVVARNNLSVNPQHTLTELPKPEILLVPGGRGTREQLKNNPLIEWIKRTAHDAEFVLSVCTGALLLGKAGLLDGLEATTHRVGFDLLRQIAPTATVRADRRFVDSGKIITSAGIAAGIDMSLYVVGRLLGPEVAAATASHMDYPFAITKYANKAS